MTTFELAAVARVSLRQLQWWDEQGICPALIQGHRRQYTAHAALLACLIAHLLRRGLTLQKIARLSLHRYLDSPVPFLLTDGKGLRPIRSAREALTAMARARQGMILVGLDDLRKTVRRTDEKGAAA